MILAVSHDNNVLHTRVEVLRKADQNVVGALLKDVEQILRAQVFDLVVLCHTLTDDEMVLVVGMAIQTQGKVIVMRPESSGKPLCSDDVISVGGRIPYVQDLLITEVVNLLGSRRSQA
jgi:hypothetical protein